MCKTSALVRLPLDERSIRNPGVPAGKGHEARDAVSLARRKRSLWLKWVANTAKAAPHDDDDGPISPIYY